MIFESEAKFEDELVELLHSTKGWSADVLINPSEDDLIDNWANIIFQKNQQRERLNGCKLTDSEMKKVLDQFVDARTPVKINHLINGKELSIVRDNPDDTLNYGKEISLRIFNPDAVKGGATVYQIARQPVFKSNNPQLNSGRGDVMLLIDGMPLFHVELKGSKVPIKQATNQIKRYKESGYFRGIYSLIQIFVAMNPDECVYFANPGPDGDFKKEYFFHWADFNNESINNWKDVGESLLSIPMAHNMISFYTVADDEDGILKVLRSYQFHAIDSILKKVREVDNWDSPHKPGGFIAHTTGSGKTLSSFKTGEVLLKRNVVDKVIYLFDRIELGVQSLNEYRGFADEDLVVNSTANSHVFENKLMSDNLDDSLIVTSIQKVAEKSKALMDEPVKLDKIAKKKIVFIVDECHRDTHGLMFSDVKNAFPNALFFGFTGTPIYSKASHNGKRNASLDTIDDLEAYFKMQEAGVPTSELTTKLVFGDELHRYSIGDGIRDGNVLAFDHYRVSTFKDAALKRSVALRELGIASEEEIYDEPKLLRRFDEIRQREMTDRYDREGHLLSKGIERDIPTAQYRDEKHRKAVVDDILDKWSDLSCYGRSKRFHAILATSSIPEAMAYYDLLNGAETKKGEKLKVTAVFDPHHNNEGDEEAERATTMTSWDKQQAILRLIRDYGETFFDNPEVYRCDQHSLFKKDVAQRLAHKGDYRGIENDRDKQLDIVIVVNQMLTGYDSKWVNTLYLDKIIEGHLLIQAFSRTNRIFGPEKPHGTIRYYRKPYTMEANTKAAIEMYSGSNLKDISVRTLDENVEAMQAEIDYINYLFAQEEIEDYSDLPKDNAVRREFVRHFNLFNKYLMAARLQGFIFKGEK